jgi:hypothetical protein
MPFDLSTTAILALYTLVFLCQIYVASIHYPRAMVRRTRQVISRFPPGEYPKLYPGLRTRSQRDAEDADTDTYTERLYRRTGAFLTLNYLIAAVGLALVAWMYLSGYSPSPKGGAEIYVMAYFFLQALPLLYAAYKEMQTNKHLRETFDAPKRRAELKPRRLFDYVSPLAVVAAAALYTLWLAFFLTGRPQDTSATSVESLVTIALISGMNIAYALIIGRYIYGRKINPYQASADQDREIRTTAHILTMSSIMVSLFLILTQAADRYALEVFDPVMASFYMQLCLIFGIGETFRRIRLDQMDFDVYKDSREEISV